MEKCDVEALWQANDQCAAARGDGYYRNDFESSLRFFQKAYADKSEQDLLMMMRYQAMKEREGWRQEFLSARGARYEGCRLANFTADTEDKRTALERLKDYGRSMPERVERGEGIILFGPKGTGKDHLASALATNAIMSYGIDVEWINGMELFGKVRDSFKDDSDTSESELLNDLIRRQVLYISDPLPPAGSLTEFQSSTLFRIIDGRYCRMRPTWVTVNVTSAAELDARMGAQNGDRLRDGALAIFCNWPTYRKAIQ